MDEKIADLEKEVSSKLTELERLRKGSCVHAAFLLSSPFLSVFFYSELEEWSGILENEAVFLGEQHFFILFPYFPTLIIAFLSSFVAIAKAREKITEISLATAESLREKQELALQSEALRHSKAAAAARGKAAPLHRHLPTAFFAGLGASRFPFGPPVPQCRLADVCLRL